MEEEKLIALPLEKVNGRVDIMTVAKVLMCQERTIISYVDKGLFPKPVEIQDGRRYFSEKEILDVLGVDNLDEELIKTSDAAKYLNLSVSKLREMVNHGYLSEIKFLSCKGTMGWMIKKEVESFKTEFIIRAINFGEKGILDTYKKTFIKLLFNEDNIGIWKDIIPENGVKLYKMVLIDNKTFDTISKESGRSGNEIRNLWIKTNKRVNSMILLFPDIIRRNEKMKIEKEYEGKMQDCNRYIKEAKNDIDSRVEMINKLILKAEDKIKIEESKTVELSIEEIELRRLKLMNTKLGDLDLSVRLMNVLKEAGIETFGDVFQLKPKEFLRFRNAGKLSLLELKTLFSNKGVQWG